MINLSKHRPSDNLDAKGQYTIPYVEKEDLKNNEILDVGYGFGWFILHAYKEGTKRVAGVETNLNTLMLAKNLLHHSNIEFIEGSVISLRYSDTKFDTITSWEVLEHIPNNTEVKIFNEIDRLLKLQSIFYLSTSYKHSLSCLMDPAWWLTNCRQYSQEKLIQLADETGYRIIKVNKRGGIWTLIYMLNLYFSRCILRVNLVLRKYFALKYINEFLSRDKEYTNIFVKFMKVK